MNLHNMNNYLLLTRKDDMVHFFKYGHWYPYCPLVNFDGDLEGLASNPKVYDALFKHANPFDYSIEYYIMHVQSEKSVTASSMLKIDMVRGIYALDDVSHSIGLNLSPEIVVNPPILRNAFTQFQIDQFKKTTAWGIENINYMFNIKVPKPSKKDNDSILEEIAKELLLGNRPFGKQHIFTYLLRYDRHQNYPKDTRGCFLDAIHVYNNWLKEGEIDAPMHEKSTTGKYIIALPSSSKYHDVLKNLNDEHKDFIKATNKAWKDYCAVAALFLILKDVFRDGIKTNGQYLGHSFDEFVEILKSNYNESILGQSLWLLSVTLNWENTYQSYYEKKALPILRQMQTAHE